MVGKERRWSLNFGAPSAQGGCVYSESMAHRLHLKCTTAGRSMLALPLSLRAGNDRWRQGAS